MKRYNLFRNKSLSPVLIISYLSHCPSCHLFATASYRFQAIGSFQNVADKQKARCPLNALDWHQETFKGNVIQNWQIWHHIRLQFDFPAVFLQYHHFKDVCWNCNVILPDDLILNIQLPIRFLPDQNITKLLNFKIILI